MIKIGKIIITLSPIAMMTLLNLRVYYTISPLHFETIYLLSFFTLISIVMTKCLHKEFNPPREYDDNDHLIL